MKQKTNIKHAGGRPVGTTMPPELLKQRVNITISPADIEIAERAGDGKVSVGIREALQFWDKSKSRKR